MKASAPVTGAISDHLRFRIAEDWEPIMLEGHLATSWNDLSDGIVWWETFGREHPSILPETTVEIVYCLTFCLNSLWYTPVIDESGRLDKDLKAHYERFIVENKASVHHMLVSGCYDLWKKNNFTFNNTILSYLDAHTVDTCILRERIGLTQK